MRGITEGSMLVANVQLRQLGSATVPSSDMMLPQGGTACPNFRAPIHAYMPGAPRCYCHHFRTLGLHFVRAPGACNADSVADDSTCGEASTAPR
jgi:hypothetical protein